MNIRLYVKGKNDVSFKDVTSENGIYLTEKSLTALMCPAPMKSYLENKPTLGNGKTILASEAYQDERDVTLTIGIKAANQTAMLEAFNVLTNYLYSGQIYIKTSFDTDKVYKLYYVSCSQLQSFFRGIALFTIKFVEPNPSDRN